MRKHTQVFRPGSGSWLFIGVILINFFFFFFYFYFWLYWISVALQAFSQFVAGRGLLSWCGARALGHVGFSSCASQALECGFSSCEQGQFLHGMWRLPRSGVKPVSPALAGRFFITEPPGKPPFNFSIIQPSFLLLLYIGPAPKALVLYQLL